MRSDATGAPIAGASVVWVDGTRRAESNAAGEYELGELPSGPRQLRFSAHGFQPLALEVLLSGDGRLRLDVVLIREPTTLPIVAVRGRTPEESARARNAGGRWRATGAELRESPAVDEPDVFRALAVAPAAQMTIESPTAVHVRGGSADQNLFLLDGAPVYSPVHSGRLLSAFSPDIVDEMVVHGAAPAARYGGRLASVIEVRTPDATDGQFAAGGFGPTALHGAAAVAIVPGTASLLIAGRRSYSGVRRGDVAELEMPGSWLDGFGKLELHLGATAIALSAFTADNGLGFPSGRGDLRNTFEWTTTTSALAVDRPLGDAGTLSLRVWRARFDAAGVWAPDSSLLTLGNSLVETGGRAVLSLRRGSGVLTGGIEVQRPRTRYDVQTRRGSEDAGSFMLAASPTVASLFVEQTWRAATRWTITAGLRESSVTALQPRFEPRLAVVLDLTSRVALSGGYARMHQYSQSLRNEESLLGTILGPDLLIAAGSGGVPVARSDEISAGLAAMVGEHARFRLDLYARAMSGLALVAPVTAAPFATTTFVRGRGRANGAAASLQWTGHRTDLVGSYGLAVVDRAPAGGAYEVGFAPMHAATIAASYRPGKRTQLRTMLGVTSQRVTTAVSDAVDWDTRDPVTGAREIAGTPNSAAGPLNSERLPMYLRLDAGVRHTIPVFNGGITTFASVNNVLSRRNVTGYAIGESAPPRSLPMLPLSLVFGVAWRF